MGMSIQELNLLIKLKEQGHIPDSASVIEIGVQQLANNFLSATSQLEKIANLFQVPKKLQLSQPAASESINGFEHLDPQAPFASIFWEWLGFRYKAIDIDETPQSIPLDLNYDEVPFDEKGKSHIVTNFGTTEHVANQLNAFKIIHDLTAVGGIMIHNLPTQGMPNHGLFNYNPKFFWMLARSNGYQCLHCDYAFCSNNYPIPKNIQDYVEQFSEHSSEKFKIYDYRLTDSSVCIVLKKIYDSPYVAPLDIATGTKTSNISLADRYWSVFKESPFNPFAK
jgi:hypothetical protein